MEPGEQMEPAEHIDFDRGLFLLTVIPLAGCWLVVIGLLIRHYW